MPRPRFQRLPEDKRDAILRTAASEFGKHGLHGASLNHILAAAGLSKGAAYYYFDDKTDLFATAVRHYFEHILRDTRFDLTELTAATFWPRVTGLMKLSFERAREWPEVQGLAKAVWKLPREEREREPLLSTFAYFHRLMADVLARGQALGVIRDDLPLDLLMALALALDEVTDRWFGEHWDKLAPADCDRITAPLLELWERVFAPVGANASTSGPKTTTKPRRRAPP